MAGGLCGGGCGGGGGGLVVRGVAEAEAEVRLLGCRAMSESGVVCVWVCRGGV